MKKVTSILTALLACGVIVQAAQDTEITTREVRNPNELKAWLEANATDAEARLAAGGSVADTLALVNANDAGTAKVTLQADKADDAGDKYGIVATDGSGLEIQSDATSKGTLATKASIESDGTITTLVGIDAIGAVDFDIGSGDVTDVTVTTDGGTVILDGSVTASDDLAATDDCTVGDDLAVTGLATVGETLAVTGIATFTAESVHNGGIDADYITVDAGYGIDNKAAGTLMVGESTATKVEVADSGVETEVQGTLDVHEGLDVNEDVTIDLNATDEEIVITQSSAAGTASTPLIFIDDDRTGATANETSEAALVIDAEGVYGIAITDGALSVEGVSTLGGAVDAPNYTCDISKGLDTQAAGKLVIGAATATSLDLGASDITTAVLGPLTVLEATGKGIDTTGAGALFLGQATATSVSIGASDIDTTILGPLNVLEATGKGIDTTGAGALYLGEAVATSVILGATDAPTTIAGGLKGKYAAKTANYTNTVDDFAISYTTSAVTTNTLPEASTVLGSVFAISLFGDTGDLVVVTDGTDKFDGAGNDILTFADAGDSCIVMATAANAYTILVNVGGTLSD